MTSFRGYDYFALLRELHRRARGDAAGRKVAPKVRFRGSVSYHFPDDAFDTVEAPGAPDEPWQVFTSFLGIANPGTRGSLPNWYSGLVVDEQRPQQGEQPSPRVARTPAGTGARPTPLRDFFDLLNHPFLALYCRAFVEHDVPLQVEVEGDAKVGRVLRSLVGFGTKGLLERLQLNPQFLLAHTAVLSQRPATAVGIQFALQQHFGVHVGVDPFVVAFHDLDPADRLTLDPARRLGLGVGTVLGDKARLTQGKFRLRVGPLDWAGFSSFLPGGDRLADLQRIVRTMVGLEFDYDVQLVLAAAELADRAPADPAARPEPGPACLRLGPPNQNSPRLGWSTWIGRRHDGDADDTLIEASELEQQAGGSPSSPATPARTSP